MSPLNPRDSEDPINPEISAVYPKARGGQEGRGLTEVMGAKAGPGRREVPGVWAH